MVSLLAVAGCAASPSVEEAESTESDLLAGRAGVVFTMSNDATANAVNRRFLFAVNAGSNELATFFVSRDSLYLVDVVPTGGEMPVSVTEHAGLVYVLHAGGT